MCYNFEINTPKSVSRKSLLQLTNRAPTCVHKKLKQSIVTRRRRAHRTTMMCDNNNNVQVLGPFA